MNSEERLKFFVELFEKQLKTIQDNHLYRLNIADFLRISLNVNCNIFDDECCFYHTKSNKKNKYMTFYKSGDGVKLTLNRLLYMNYVNASIGKHVIKTKCKKTGCCNVNHLVLIDTNYKKKRN